MPIRYTWTLLLLCVVALAPASAKQERLRDELITVLQSDAEMQTAIAKAREGLAAFWEVFSQRKNGDAGSGLKTRATDGGNAAHILTSLLQRGAGKAFSATANDSKSVKRLGFGDQIEWVEADISEGLPRCEEKTAVGHVSRRFLPQAPLAEIEWVRQFLAEP